MGSGALGRDNPQSTLAHTRTSSSHSTTSPWSPIPYPHCASTRRFHRRCRVRSPRRRRRTARPAAAPPPASTTAPPAERDIPANAAARERWRRWMARHSASWAERELCPLRPRAERKGRWHHQQPPDPRSATTRAAHSPSTWARER